MTIDTPSQSSDSVELGASLLAPLTNPLDPCLFTPCYPAPRDPNVLTDDEVAAIATALFELLPSENEEEHTPWSTRARLRAVRRNSLP